MNKKYKITLAVIGILLTLSIMISSSYAYYIFSISQSGTNVVRSDCFEITYSDGNAINLTDGIPLNDKEAKELDPYTFTIKNICHTTMDYNVNIETLNSSSMNVEYVRAKIDDFESFNLGTIEDNDSSVILNKTIASSSKTIKKGVLEPNEFKTYNLRIFIDENSTYEQSGNKTYSSKVVVTSFIHSDNVAKLISGPLLNKTFKELSGMEINNMSKYYELLMAQYRLIYVAYTSDEEHYIEAANDFYDIYNNYSSGSGNNLIEIQPYEDFKNEHVADYNNLLEQLSDPTAFNFLIIEEDFNGFLMNQTSDISNILISTEPPASGVETKVISTDDSKVEAVAWYDNNNIYIYSSSDTLYLNSNSNYTFSGLTGLNTIDFSHFDYSDVNTMSGLFFLSNLNNLNYSFLDTSNVKDMSYFFFGSSIMIDDYSIINTSNATNMKGMFYRTITTNLDFSTLDTTNVTNMCGMFMELNYNYFESLSDEEKINEAKKKVIFDFDTNGVTDMSYLFYGLLYDSIDISHLNTSKVTNMGYMFYDMKNITSLDLSTLDTTNVENMSYMFRGLKGLTSIDISHLNTSKVTNMHGLFMFMDNLTSLDLSTLDTTNVTDMGGMFYGLSKLTSIDISHLNTSKVTNMGYMFCDMKSITSLDLSTLDTTNVTDMSGMFERLEGLTSLDVSHLNTSKVTKMGDMFHDMKNITSLDLSNFDTSNVTDMNEMFQNCSKITELDLSSFDTSKVTNISRMFIFMYELKTIYVSDKWNTENATTINDTFASCNKLVGGSGTSFSGSNDNGDYARVDDPTNEKPGYFTLKTS